MTICDLLIVFSQHMSQNPLMEPLVYQPGKEMQFQLGNFLNNKVFIEDEDGEWREDTAGDEE